MSVMLNLKNDRQVFQEDYIKAKTLDLQESGFSTVTEDSVRLDLDKVLNHEPLTIIGSLIQDDLEI